MGGTPVVVVAAGGLPVVEATNGLGVPVAEASNGYGRPVTIAVNGYGTPVVFSPARGPATAPSNLFPPIVSVVGGGAAQVPAVLVCSQGTWVGTDPKTYDYQWYRTPAAVAQSKIGMLPDGTFVNPTDAGREAAVGSTMVNT